jgi:hypothetical protein
MYIAETGILDAVFIEIADAAWADYEETGLHITLDEAKAWARALKTEPSATLAPCHT